MKRTIYNKTLRRPLRGVVVAGLLSVMLLAGCSKERISVTDGELQQREIRIAASTAESGSGIEPQQHAAYSTAAYAPGTRATVGTSAALADAKFLVKHSSSAVTSMAGATPFTGSRAGDATGAVTWASDNQPLYQPDGKTAYIAAYWPGTASVANAKATWAIDGKTDILTTGIWDAGTYTAPKTGTGAGQTPMAFHHALAQLEVVCKTSNSDAEAIVQQTWGKITKIELLNSYPSATYDFATGTVTGSGSSGARTLAAANYTADFATVAIAANTTNTVTAAGMFVPAAANSTATINLKVYTQKNSEAEIDTEISVQLKDGSSGAKGFEAGLKHTVTLIFKAEDKQIGVASTKISAWTQGYRSESEIQPSTERPVHMVFGGENAGVTTGISDYTLDSYSTYTAASNGTKYSTAASGYAGEKPYLMLEIASEGEPELMTWAAAYALCQGKSNGNWRLPRLSELTIMCLNYNSLEASGGFVSFRRSVGYWSGTESSESNAWSQQISDFASATAEAKSELRAVRCVQEIVPMLNSDEERGGVIVALDPTDKSTLRVVAFEDQQPAANITSYASGALSSVAVSGAQSMTDGYANTQALRAKSLSGEEGATGELSVDYPAAGLCYNYKGPKGTDPVGTWYLPAIDELALFYEQRNTIADNQIPGWVGLPPSSGYFSSTENSDNPQRAWWLQLANQTNTAIKKNTGGKWDTGYIRCFRKM